MPINYVDIYNDFFAQLNNEKLARFTNNFYDTTPADPHLRYLMRQNVRSPFVNKHSLWGISVQTGMWNLSWVSGQFYGIIPVCSTEPY